MIDLLFVVVVSYLFVSVYKNEVGYIFFRDTRVITVCFIVTNIEL